MSSLKFGQKIGQEILIILIVAISVKIITLPIVVWILTITSTNAENVFLGVII